MAKINTVISLKDKFSAPLKKITKTLKQTEIQIDKVSAKLFKLNQMKQAFDFGKTLVVNVTEGINKLASYYDERSYQEMRLNTVLKERLGLNKEERDEVRQTVMELSKSGIYDYTTLASGAQELATFVHNKDELKTLLSATANISAQQLGFSAGAKEMQTLADMVGKTYAGSITAMSKFGYTFTDAEEKILHEGTDMERVKLIADMVTNSIGNANEALATLSMRGGTQKAMNNIKENLEDIGEAFSSIRYVMIKVKEIALSLFKDVLVKAGNYVKNNIRPIISSIADIGSAVITVGSIIFGVIAVMNYKTTILATAMLAILKAIYDSDKESNDMTTSMVSLARVVSTFVGLFMQGFTIIYDIVAFVHDRLLDLHDVIKYALNPFSHIKLDPKLELLLFAIKSMTSLSKPSFKDYEVTKPGRWNRMEVPSIDSITAKGEEFAKKMAEQLDEAIKGMDKFIEARNDTSPGKELLDTLETCMNDDNSINVKDKALIQLGSEYLGLLSDMAYNKFNDYFSRPPTQIEINGTNIYNNQQMDDFVESLSNMAN